MVGEDDIPFFKKRKKEKKNKEYRKKKLKKNQFQTSPTTVKLKSQHNGETNMTPSEYMHLKITRRDSDS